MLGQQRKARRGMRSYVIINRTVPFCAVQELVLLCKTKTRFWPLISYYLQYKCITPFEYLLSMIPQFLFLYFREKSTPTLSYLPQGGT